MELNLLPDNTLLSVDTLASLLQSRDTKNPLVVLDCRFSLADTGLGRRQYERGHISGAIYAPRDDDLAGELTARSGLHPLPEVDQFVHRLRSWGVSSNSPIVVYDDRGGAWQKSGQTISTEIEPIDWNASNHGNSFVANIDNSIMNKVDELVELLKSRKIILCDARAEPRFAGRHEPIDPVAGHIPGAINLPFEENLDKNGIFLWPNMLKRHFKKMLDRTNCDGQIVHMCGSGVIACQNMLAMENAGIGLITLHVGSWSEWITDQAREVAIERSPSIRTREDQ